MICNPDSIRLPFLAMCVGVSVSHQVAIHNDFIFVDIVIF